MNFPFTEEDVKLVDGADFIVVSLGNVFSQSANRDVYFEHDVIAQAAYSGGKLTFTLLASDGASLTVCSLATTIRGWLESLVRQIDKLEAEHTEEKAWRDTTDKVVTND